MPEMYMFKDFIAFIHHRDEADGAAKFIIYIQYCTGNRG